MAPDFAHTILVMDTPKLKVVERDMFIPRQQRRSSFKTVVSHLFQLCHWVEHYQNDHINIRSVSLVHGAFP
jgi:hypothetical protein